MDSMKQQHKHREEVRNMDVIQKATVDMLTNTSVSILTQKFVKVDGKETQLGKNHRKAYVNTEAGRQALMSEQEEATVQAVFAIWGDAPTVSISNEEQETESE